MRVNVATSHIFSVGVVAPKVLAIIYESHNLQECGGGFKRVAQWKR